MAFNRAITAVKPMTHAVPRFKITILLLLLLSTKASTSPDYLGCFLYDNLNITNGIQPTLSTATTETCADECLARNYAYAEFSDSLCRCTNNYMSTLTKETDDDGCSNAPPCTKNTTPLPYKCQTRIKTFRTRTDSSEASYPRAIYLGCYKEKKQDDSNRLLKFPYEGYPDNVPQKCSEECFKIGFLYSGTTYGMSSNSGDYCWCGNQQPANKFKTRDLKCDAVCSGDRTKKCGGAWYLSIYATGIVDYPLGNYVGCFHLDESNQSVGDTMTLKISDDLLHRCYYICNVKGHRYAEISDNRCKCSDEKPSTAVDEEFCKLCDNYATLYCGGDNTVSVYENNWFGKVTGELSKNHFGCFQNTWTYPVMDGWNISYFPAGLTSEKCVSGCYARQFPYAALVSLNECLCSFVSPSLDGKVDDSHCRAACSGDSVRECGDPAHYNVFATGLQTSRVPGHHYVGCYNDSDSNDMWTAEMTFAGVNTPHLCSEYCDKSDYRYFGVGTRTRCLCGNTPPAHRPRTEDDKCAVPYYCPGDANKHCGGYSATAVFRIGAVADIIYNCSAVCDCYVVPKYNIYTIDCSNKKLMEYPEIYPVFENVSSSINLILKNNRFERLPNLTSLQIVSLDMSNNSITKLDANLLPKSLKVLHVNNNKLKFTDENVRELLQRLDVITLSGNPWTCDCNSKTDLLEYKPNKIGDLYGVTCASPETGRLTKMNSYDLCPEGKSYYVYAAIVCCCLVVFVCSLSVYVGARKWCATPAVQTDTDAKQSSSETFMQRIQYGELVLATNNWDPARILGRGGFGIVYKGNWRHTDVAIKRLNAEGIAEKIVNMHTRGDELQLNSCKEIMYLNVIKHDNILPMYGFCFYATGSCLIYQFMANGSLEDRLQRKNGTKPLSWIVRGNIAVGIARGLQFLHDIENPLIHGDIKSANILLDSNFEPRIGDFGLARSGRIEGSFDVSHVCGTKPYLPDDFFQSKKLSTKVDTYSFGVVLFEIATGLRAFYKHKNNKHLKDHVNELAGSSLSDIADKTAGQDTFRVFDSLVGFGKQCVANKPKNRPEMVTVYTNLQNVMSSITHSSKGAAAAKNTESAVIGQLQETEENRNANLWKLNKIKGTLLAPLHEIPSISALYSDSTVDENDSRQVVTADQKLKNNELNIMTDEGCFTTDF